MKPAFLPKIGNTIMDRNFGLLILSAFAVFAVYVIYVLFFKSIEPSRHRRLPPDPVLIAQEKALRKTFKGRFRTVQEQVEFEFVRYVLFCHYFGVEANSRSDQIELNNPLLNANQDLRDARNAFDDGFYLSAQVCVDAAFEAKVEVIVDAGIADRATALRIREMINSKYPRAKTK